MRTWLRQSWPPGIALVAFLMIYAVMAFGPRRFVLHAAPGFPEPDQYRALSEGGLIILYLSCVAWAIYRVWKVHPLLRLKYREWLMQTPWRYPLPLLNGPVQLVPQDFLLLALISPLTLLHNEGLFLLPTILFLTSYLVMLSLTFVLTGARGIAYLIGLGMVVLFQTKAHPVLVTVCLLGLYWLARIGLRQSLTTFHEWDFSVLEQQSTISLNSEQLRRQRDFELGWPFDALAPKQSPFELGPTTVVAAAAFVSWWLLILNFSLAEYLNGVTLLGVIYGGFILAPVRAVYYLNGYRPPISFIGRVLTGRWIIPGYDIIFLAPLIVIAINLTVFGMLDLRVPQSHFLAPILASAQILILGLMPPSMRRWRLTGQHRITDSFSLNPRFQQTQ